MKKRILLCFMFGALTLVLQAQIPPVSHINVNNVNGTILNGADTNSSDKVIVV